MFRNIKTNSLILAGALAITGCQSSSHQEDKQTEGKPLTSYVDPFIGTAAHGHVFPGATLPFGGIQLTPNNGVSGWDWCSGYNYESDTLAGFSHLALSGTGIGDLGDLLILPTTKTISDPQKGQLFSLPYRDGYSHKNEKAEPGYYSVQLTGSKILAEMTTTQRVGVHRYTFPKGEAANLVVDLGFAINWDHPYETAIELKDNQLITGYRHSNGWAKDQKVYFAAKFSQPVQSLKLAKKGAFVKENSVAGKDVAAALSFENNGKPLVVKISISSANIEGALANLEKECPDWDFDRVRQEAHQKWESELAKVQVKTEDENLKTIFYTALYRSQVAPNTFSDVNGGYKGLDGKTHKAEGFTRMTVFSLWDTFRAAHPLYTIVQPERVNNMLASMLAVYGESGLLPFWELVGNETFCMIGYHAIPPIVDAYFKGFKFDHEKAYEAMKTTAMFEREGIQYVNKLKYIPADKVNESVSKALEYAYDDWCIAQMAKALGKTEDYNYFLKRANLYKEYFDGETGFMRGKMANGKWRTPFDPLRSSHRVDDYTEANAWQVSWFAPHDVNGLIKLNGGRENFYNKLNKLFSLEEGVKGKQASADISGLIGGYAHGNEPSHHTAYLFACAGYPWRTQEVVRQVMEELYTSAPDGLCGNEDCGQMSAWYVLSSMGFYPVNPATGNYVIGSPMFKETKIKVAPDTYFTIKAPNASKENKYIQSASLNGKPLETIYFTHKDLVKGGTLELEMGSTPNKKWGSNPEATIPSMTK